MKHRFTNDQLCDLAELELSPEEEWSELYREWKKNEIEELWLELKRIEEIRLRRLHNRRQHIEKLLGVRLNVRVPKSLVHAPDRIVSNSSN
jgi:hypothetical protein